MERQGWLLTENVHHRWLQVRLLHHYHTRHHGHYDHDHQRCNTNTIFIMISWHYYRTLSSSYWSSILISLITPMINVHWSASVQMPKEQLHEITINYCNHHHCCFHHGHLHDWWQAILNNVIYYLEEPPDNERGEVDFSLPHPSDQVHFHW